MMNDWRLWTIIVVSLAAALILAGCAHPILTSDQLAVYHRARTAASYPLTEQDREFIDEKWKARQLEYYLKSRREP